MACTVHSAYRHTALVVRQYRFAPNVSSIANKVVRSIHAAHGPATSIAYVAVHVRRDDYLVTPGALVPGAPFYASAAQHFRSKYARVSIIASLNNVQYKDLCNSNSLVCLPRCLYSRAKKICPPSDLCENCYKGRFEPPKFKDHIC